MMGLEQELTPLHLNDDIEGLIKKKEHELRSLRDKKEAYNCSRKSIFGDTGTQDKATRKIIDEEVKRVKKEKEQEI